MPESWAGPRLVGWLVNQEVGGIVLKRDEFSREILINITRKLVHMSRRPRSLADRATNKEDTPLPQISVTQAGNDCNRLLGARHDKALASEGLSCAPADARRHTHTPAITGGHARAEAQASRARWRRHTWFCRQLP